MEAVCECGAAVWKCGKGWTRYECGRILTPDSDDAETLRHWCRLALYAREALWLVNLSEPPCITPDDVDAQIIDDVSLGGTMADWVSLCYAVAERRVLDELEAGDEA